MSSIYYNFLCVLIEPTFGGDRSKENITGCQCGLRGVTVLKYPKNVVDALWYIYIDVINILPNATFCKGLENIDLYQTKVWGLKVIFKLVLLFLRFIFCFGLD